MQVASTQAAAQIATYDFSSRDPSRVEDVSDSSDPVTLFVETADQVGRGDGHIELKGKSMVRSSQPASKITRAVQRSNELTLSVWLTPAKTKQSGPARIVTISDDSSNRNITLGQDGDRFDVRLRSTKTSTNGLPSLASPKRAVVIRQTNVVFTRDHQGLTRLFINGKQVSKGKAAGTLRNWNKDYRIAFGDELSGGRPWLGTLHRVEWYADALDSRAVAKLYQSGVEGNSRKELSPEAVAARNFETQVAPLIAKHCLECHDTASAKGDLVLDRKEPALRGSVVPGNAEESTLWTSVENDEMPHNRAPLLDEEKAILRRWIEDGAAWSLGWIDPADYQHESGSSSGFVRRLTTEEYIRSVQTAVGVDISHDAHEWLPRDVRADGFSNTSYNLTVDLKHVEAYHRLAKRIADQIAIKPFAKRFGGKGRLTDNDMRGLIERMGRWILRGPLSEEEVVWFRGISTTAAASGGDYETATRATISAMLQAPRFLYRIEDQNLDGSTAYIDQHALASRLSYLVWGSPPDNVLMKAAEEGQLGGEDEVRQQVKRMLADPKAVERSVDFVSQWLHLDHLESLQPDPERFPQWDAKLARDMQSETREFFRYLVWERKAKLAELLSANVTFLTPALAKLYGITPSGPGMRRYDLSDHPSRGGILTQGSVLTIGGDDASMVTRGLFVLNQLLRGVVNDPPPCVDTTPVPTAAGLSQRAIATSRIKNEACGGCHGRFEPLAFGLERYDGIGRYSVKDEHGNALRQDGEIKVPGSRKPELYDSAPMLMKKLSELERVQESLVWKLTQFAVGRPLTADDAKAVRAIHQQSKIAGGTYQDILTEIACSRLVTP